MKALLVALVLSLVYAEEAPLSEEVCTQISGPWRTVYLASDHMEAISENHPLRCYFRHMECHDQGQSVSVVMYSKENGACVLHNKLGKSIGYNLYTTDYAGTVEFSVLDTSDAFMVIVGDNTNEEGQTTRVMGAFAKGSDIIEENHQTFLNLAAEKGIPAENVIKVTDTDTCPDITN